MPQAISNKLRGKLQKSYGNSYEKDTVDMIEAKEIKYTAAAFEKLQFYKNICQIRIMVFDITKRFDKYNVRLVSQMRDAARSAKQNIREGYGKDSAGEFAHYVKISRGSLFELEGDVEDCRNDKLISEKEFVVLNDIFIKTKYQMDNFIDSIYKLEQTGKWKTRFKRNVQ